MRTLRTQCLFGPITRAADVVAWISELNGFAQCSFVTTVL